MLRAYLQSRVAQRLFGLFLLVALGPLMLFGAFSYTHMRSHLVEVGQAQLRTESKDYGMLIVDRLARRAKTLGALDAARIDAGAGDAVLRQEFSRIDWLMESAAVPSLDAAELRHLDRGGIVLRIAADAPPAMFMRRPGEPRIVRAELHPRSLWESDAMVRPHCVIGLDGTALFCSAEAPGISLGQALAAAEHAGVIGRRIGDQDHLVAYWRALLPAVYANPGFYAVTMQPRAEVLAALGRFHRVFPVVLALALAVAIWLAMRQIRRQLRPLDDLVNAANRLADGRFHGVLEVSGGDEFDDVGRAFDLMRRRLKNKFGLLGLLAELDRAVLSGAPMETLLQAVIKDAPAALGCDLVAVLRLDDLGSTPSWNLNWRLAEGDQDTAISRAQIHPATRELLACAERSLELGADPAWGEILDRFVALGMSRAWVFSTPLTGERQAGLIAAYREGPAQLSDLQQAGRSIADRLAVAQSGLAWEEKLYRNTHFDALTQLPNQVLLRDRVEQAIDRARKGASAAAVLLLDLDDLKAINDSLGHALGDQLLVELAARLVEQLREGESVARLNGDTFVILVPDVLREARTTVASTRAEDLLRALARPVSLQGHAVSSAASIGIALFPDNGATFEELLKGADSAMHEAKLKDRGSYRFYSAEINLRARQRFDVVQRLRTALDRDEFLLHFQPKVEIASGRITGAEALIRWLPSGGTLVMPGDFIHLVDEIGMSARLGDWVMRTACRQLVDWDHAGFPPIAMSVNVSPAQFNEAGFVGSVSHVLAASGLPPRRLELEILEQTAVDTSALTGKVLAQLRDLGVQIALDDFGTGYSSLVYLTQLPATILKLDRGFIRTLATDARQAAMVGAIISLGQRLGMQIVAEGVEDEAQRTLLGELGCDLMQGYLFSRPVAPQEFAALLERERAGLGEIGGTMSVAGQA